MAATTDTSRSCPHCGQPAADGVYCGGCGQPIDPDGRPAAGEPVTDEIQIGPQGASELDDGGAHAVRRRQPPGRTRRPPRTVPAAGSGAAQRPRQVPPRSPQPPAPAYGNAPQSGQGTPQPYWQPAPGGVQERRSTKALVAVLAALIVLIAIGVAIAIMLAASGGSTPTTETPGAPAGSTITVITNAG
ncbi:MAG: hypothetical protein ACLP01_05530 [Solirubrobacteraceae bacterium]